LGTNSIGGMFCALLGALHWRLDWLLHWQCVGIGVDQLRDFILTSSLLGHGLKGALLCVADEVVPTYS
jgi:hypothetical protein